MIRVLRRAPALLSLLLLTACGGEQVVSPPAAAPSSATATASGSPTASPSPSPSPSDTRQVITLTYAGGKVTGDTGRVKVPVGTTVLLRITSDVADEVHVHGVDRYVDLT